MKSNKSIILVVHNVRSAHNVGSLLRTADGLGIEAVYLTGYSPYPQIAGDERPPHIRKKISSAIAKTALGAEKTITWRHYQHIQECLDDLSAGGFSIAALEQTPHARDLADFKPQSKFALIVGTEVGGLEQNVLELAIDHIQIPMLGKKESFNVSVAAAIALYHLGHLDKNTS